MMALPYCSSSPTWPKALRYSLKHDRWIVSHRILMICWSIGSRLWFQNVCTFIQQLCRSIFSISRSSRLALLDSSPPAKLLYQVSHLGGSHLLATSLSGVYLILDVDLVHHYVSDE